MCGDILRLSARFDAERIVTVNFKARGCTASIAAGSALTELILGSNGAELEGITAERVEENLGGLSPESRHAAVLCADAVKALASKRGQYR